MWTNRGDAVSDLGLRCLPMSLKKDARLTWANSKCYNFSILRFIGMFKSNFAKRSSIWCILCLSVFVFDLFCITLCPFSFALILKRKRESWLLCFYCLTDVFVTVYVLWNFLEVPWVGLWCVIAVFPGHAHFLFVRWRISFKCLSKKSVRLI